VLTSCFAVSEPNLWTSNLIDHDARAKQVETEIRVSSLLQMLCGDTLCRQVTDLPYLRVGLACNLTT
jgi:hypothetical protein